MAKRFIHESLQDTQSVVKYLEALAEGFRNGSLVLASDEAELTLIPRGLLRLEVDAKRKASEVKLAIRLRWTEEEGHGDPPRGSLQISSSGEEPGEDRD